MGDGTGKCVIANGHAVIAHIRAKLKTLSDGFGSLRRHQTPACLPAVLAYTGTMRFLLAFGAVCFAALTVSAQQPQVRPPTSLVEFQMAIKQKRFLPGEAIEVEIALLNNSGAPLTFSPEDGWLEFTVVNLVKPTGEGTAVPRLKPVVINETFTVKHTDSAKAKVDLAPGFDLTRPGQYKVSASMIYQGARAPIAAEPVVLSVVRGYKLMDDLPFGMPSSDPESPPEARKYSLQQLTLTESVEIRLYVSVTDVSEATVFRQVPLGRMAGHDKPPTRLDRLSNLHVLHQTGARLFTHTVVSPRGDVLVRETFDSLGARLALKSDSEGAVTVSNGVRLPRSDDLLPIKLEAPPSKVLATP